MAHLSKSVAALDVKDSFDRDGYLTVEPLFDFAKMTEINIELDRFIADRVQSMGKNEVYYEDINDRTSIKQMMNMHDHDPYFDDLLRNSDIRTMAETALNNLSDQFKRSVGS